jgi:hypothetical protein
MFPESGAAQGAKQDAQPALAEPSPDQVAFMQVMRGIHL